MVITPSWVCVCVCVRVHASVFVPDCKSRFCVDGTSVLLRFILPSISTRYYKDYLTLFCSILFSRPTQTSLEGVQCVRLYSTVTSGLFLFWGGGGVSNATSLHSNVLHIFSWITTLQCGLVLIILWRMHWSYAKMSEFFLGELSPQRESSMVHPLPKPMVRAGSLGKELEYPSGQGGLCESSWLFQPW